MFAATHILLGGPDQSPLELRTSMLASARLRLAVAAAAAQKMGQHVTIGEHCPEKADNLLIGKIGANNLEARQKLWLPEIQQLKLQGAKIVLDYTDHHLGNNSVMTPFYRAASELADVICVPTHSLKIELVEQFNFRCSIEIIPDLLEYEIVRPKEKAVGPKPVGLWFGHPSNAEFLAKFIDSHHNELMGHQLNIVSTAQSLEVLKKYPFSLSPTIAVSAFQWNVPVVAQIAKTSDYCVIPSDPKSPKKFASNNRLVTALTLGLPTLATELPSYIEFRDHFAPIGSEAGNALLTNPTLLKQSIQSFQALHAARFGSSQLEKQWAHLLG